MVGRERTQPLRGCRGPGVVARPPRGVAARQPWAEGQRLRRWSELGDPVPGAQCPVRGVAAPSDLAGVEPSQAHEAQPSGLPCNAGVYGRFGWWPVTGLNGGVGRQGEAMCILEFWRHPRGRSLDCGCARWGMGLPCSVGVRESRIDHPAYGPRLADGRPRFARSGGWADPQSVGLPVSG